MKKRILTSLLLLLLVLLWSTAWADFYVIAAGKRAKRTVLVSPKSTATASGTALLNVLDSITNASESNPYLIIIEPGEYDIEDHSLQMKSHVDIQGSGEDVTTITGDNIYKNNGVVKGKDVSELRFLTVENTGGGYYATAISNYGEDPSLLHVTVTASGGTENRGVYNRNGSSPTMTHVNIFAQGGTKSYGVENYWSSPIMTHVTVEVTGGTTNYGVFNGYYSSSTMSHVTVNGKGDSSHGGYGVHTEFYSSVWINHSVIDGYNNSIECISGTTYVGNTQLKGGPVYDYSGSAVKCAGVYNGAYTFYPSTCP